VNNKIVFRIAQKTKEQTKKKEIKIKWEQTSETEITKRNPNWRSLGLEGRENYNEMIETEKLNYFLLCATVIWLEINQHVYL